MDTQPLEKLARLIRYHILRMTHQAGSGHPTSCFSAVDLATVLFFRYFQADLDNFNNLYNDRLIFSKGHASALLYSLYAAAGKLTDKELDGYRTFSSTLEGHPTTRFAYTEAATGSLGQGLSIGAGEAFALRKKLTVNSLQLTENSCPRVYVLLGDGELAEGSVWEAAAWASHEKLNNIVAVVDANGFGQAEETMYHHDANTYSQRFNAFGWAAIVIDGHNYQEIDAAYQKALLHKDSPVAIIARTVKGKGIAYWEDKPGWHNKMLPKEELEKALEEYKPKGEVVVGIVKKPSGALAGAPLAVPPPNPMSFWQTSRRVRPESDEDPGQARMTSAKDMMGLENLPAGKAGARRAAPSFSPQYPPKDFIATKKAFGNALERLGKSYPDLLVLDGDVSNSTHTDQFKNTYPERFLQMYIAEQNMVGVATGLARRGLKPLVSTFAAFLGSRPHDQLRMIPLSDATVLFNGSYAGVSMGKDGPSQMGLEDMATFRSIFGSTVLYPSDPYATEKLVEAMMDHRGVVYIRTTREPTPVIYGPEDGFPVGGSKVFSSRITNNPASPAGRDSRITIIAAGITVHEALKSQKQLVEEGIGVTVIDCYSVKPIDILTLKKYARESKAMIVVEDHYPAGGLGEAVMSALAGEAHCPIVHLAVYKLPHSGSPADLLSYEEIDSEAIIKTVKKFF